MNILIIGDIVGKAGINKLKETLINAKFSRPIAGYEFVLKSL